LGKIKSKYIHVEIVKSQRAPDQPVENHEAIKVGGAVKV
jgi:hypothetical protein